MLMGLRFDEPKISRNRYEPRKKEEEGYMDDWQRRNYMGLMVQWEGERAMLLVWEWEREREREKGEKRREDRKKKKTRNREENFFYIILFLKTK